MAEPPEHDLDLAIDGFLDELLAGPSEGTDFATLDPQVAATLRRVQSLNTPPPLDPDFPDRLWTALSARRHTTGGGTFPLALPLRTVERPATRLTPVHATPCRHAHDKSHWILAQISTAALLLLVLGLCTLFVGLGRAPQPARFPAPMAAVPSAPVGATTETLLDVTANAVPTGHATIAVDRWRLHPDSPPLAIPSAAGVVMLVVESGAITVSLTGTEQHLAAGVTFDVGGQPFALQASGSQEAIALIVSVTAELPSDRSVIQFTDTSEWLISAAATALPGGRARLILERLTLPAGSVLPPWETRSLMWLGVQEGTLGLTLAGDHLPFRWQAGDERTFRHGQYLPPLQPGTQLTLRSAGADPVVLVRLTLLPISTDDGVVRDTV